MGRSNLNVGSTIQFQLKEEGVGKGEEEGEGNGEEVGGASSFTVLSWLWIIASASCNCSFPDLMMIGTTETVSYNKIFPH